MKTDPESFPDRDTPMFETFFRVRFHEVDALGHVNNSAYLNYLEQAAIDHATFLGLSLERLRSFGGVFVARRHDIVFLRPTYAGDLLRVLTWLEEPHGARVERRYLVSRETALMSGAVVAGRLLRLAAIPDEKSLVVRAMTEWVFASVGGQPRRIPQGVMTLFHSSPPEDPAPILSPPHAESG